MTLTVRLPETMESQLTRFCEAMGVSKSQVVQTALKDWFAKPAEHNTHPLLAFAQQASAAAPGTDWAGPYSKERMRARVMAGVGEHRLNEPVAEYAIPPKKSTSRRKAAGGNSKNRRAQTNMNKSVEAVSLAEGNESAAGADGA